MLQLRACVYEVNCSCGGDCGARRKSKSFGLIVADAKVLIR